MWVGEMKGYCPMTRTGRADNGPVVLAALQLKVSADIADSLRELREILREHWGMEV
jgi:hypothetical protein